MVNYPEWVMKHKKKGTYINFVKGKYYLYAAHSKRIPGTKIVKRICDGYLGRITEKDGLIPPRDKVSGTVEVYEFGRSAAILSLCQNIHSGLKRNFKSNADSILVAAILSIIYGKYSSDLLQQSFLLIKFPEVDLEKKFTAKQETAIERSILMLRDTLSKTFKNDMDDVMIHLSTLHKVKINKRLYTSKMPDNVQKIIENYQLKMEV
jgi:hypothetical protein